MAKKRLAKHDDRRMESAQLSRRLGESAVRTKLRRAICRFPSEWDQNTVVERYSWLLTEDRCGTAKYFQDSMAGTK